ncbi:MAG: segregation and condensation protein A [Hyphomicrobiaceae bacterium]|jgi:segregation and condensation protein A
MTAAAGYTVKLDAFEGPLDLLLHLVRTNEVDIYHLPVATITDQYLAYLDIFEELNLNVAGEYLVMAASLMYMKSRLLLPADEDAEEDEEDSVGDLVRQLADYQRYREAAEALRDRVLLDRDVFRRTPTKPDPREVETDDAGYTRVEMGDLFEALRRVLARAAARRPHTVEGEEYSVADAVRTMVDRLRTRGRVRFEEVFEPDAPRGFVIATFVGMLELMKMGAIEAEQEGAVGPILLRLVSDKVEETIAALDEMYGAASGAGFSVTPVGEEDAMVSHDKVGETDGGEGGDA